MLTIAIVVFANFAIQDRLLVAGNVAETARNIVEHERLFRFGIACELIYGAGITVLLAALYVILEPVDRLLALIGAVSRLAYALTWLLMTLDLFSALKLFRSNDYLRIFEPDRLQALGRMYIGARFETYYAGLFFYGLASSVCSWLWVKSGYLPRGLAVFGVISSVWAVACTLAFIVSPDFSQAVNLWWFDSPLGLFEITLSFWLLIKGLRPR